MYKHFYVLLFICIILIQICHLKAPNRKTSKIDPHLDDDHSVLAVQPRRRCPLCDSSVFSYCTDKLFHDSCCCNNPHNPHYPLPPQCQFADCSFLHANSCQEHKLITACCCISHFNFFHKQ